VGLLNLCSALYLTGGMRALAHGIWSDPAALGFASLLQVGDQLGFTFSFLTNDTARAMLFISLNPVWAALLGWLILGDKLPIRTMGLLCAGVCSTLIVFVPELISGLDGQAEGPEHRADDHVSAHHQPATLAGDAISFGTGLCLASYVTFIRYCAKYRPKAAIDAAPSVGNFAAALIALCMSSLSSGGVSTGIHMGGFLPVVALNAILVAAFYIGFTLAPRYITGAEVALILLMETVCGPLWVFFRFGDVPSMWTVIGGAVLVCALAVHELMGMGEAHVSDSQSCALDLCKSSPVMRLSSSPPQPSLTTKHAALAPSDADRTYHCFSNDARQTQPSTRQH